MKYIAPGSWFSLEYPADWREFEDTEDSFCSTIRISGREISVSLLTGEKAVIMPKSALNMKWHKMQVQSE